MNAQIIGILAKIIFLLHCKHLQQNLSADITVHRLLHEIQLNEPSVCWRDAFHVWEWGWE